MTEPLEVPSRALTVGAHPDDAEFGIGGTLARWTSQGCQAFMLVVTDGSKGSWDLDTDPDELIDERRDEQLRAGEVLGVEEVVFLDHRDGELEYTMALREEVCGWIRRLRPEVVAGHDPWARYMLHPDHRAAGWATVDGLVAARDHLFFPEQLRESVTAHRPSWLLLWAADEPDHWEDISGTIDAKVEALLCHRSQGTTTMDGAQRGPSEREAFRQKIVGRAAEVGAPVGLGAAEAFRRIRP